MSPGPSPVAMTVDGSDRRRYLRACAVGALPAVVLFAAVLAMNGVGFHGNEYTTNFHTEQMRSLLHLHWDISPSVLGIEGFRHGHKWFSYYGLFPGLFRLPFLIISPDLANRITQKSMLVGFVVAMRAISLLLWRIRPWFGFERAPDRRERIAAGGFVFVAGAGSTLLYLGADAWIYHETEIWGAALALSAFGALLGALEHTTGRRIAIAGAWTSAAIMTRGSVGTGPAVSLMLVGVAVMIPRLRSSVGLDPAVARRWAVGFIAAGVVPIALYSATNYARFENPVVFPTAQQKMSEINPQRIRFLADSGGSYFGVKFAPTTLGQYFRPDALRLDQLAPFIDFPTSGHVVGKVVFDAFEPASSIPDSMPALSVLAVMGFVVMLGPRRRRMAPIRAPVLGAAVGAAAVVPFGYVANRYLADFVPLLVLLAAVGLQRLLAARAHAPTPGEDHSTSERRRPWRRAIWATLAVLSVVSVLVNVALSISYHYTGPWAPEHISAPFLVDAIRLHETIPGGNPTFRRVRSLPVPPPSRGTIAVVGNCDGVYVSAGDIPSLAWSPWRGIERGIGAGRYDFTVAFPLTAPVSGAIEPLVIRGEPGHLQTLAAIYQSGNVVRFAFASEDHERLPRLPENSRGFIVGRGIHYEPGQRHSMTVVMDPYNGHIQVDIDHHLAARIFQPELTPEQNSAFIFPAGSVAFGRNGVGAPTLPAFTGSLIRRPTPRPPLCRTLGVK